MSGNTITLIDNLKMSVNRVLEFIGDAKIYSGSGHNMEIGTQGGGTGANVIKMINIPSGTQTNVIGYNDLTGQLYYQPATSQEFTITNPGPQRLLTDIDGSSANAEAKLTFDGTTLGITGSIVPGADNVYTLGTEEKRWNHLYVGSGSISIGNTVLSSDISNNLIISHGIFPSEDNIFSLGNTESRWRDCYIGPGTLNIAGPTGSIKDATLGSDLAGIAYTEFGFATPFINIGPNIDVPNAVGGWQIGVTGLTDGTGMSSFDVIAQENTSNGLTGTIYSIVKNPITRYIQNVLAVNGSSGNDSLAQKIPYSYPFKTITSAIDASISGDCVYVYPGTYNEAITIKEGVSVRGINVNAVTI